MTCRRHIFLMTLISIKIKSLLFQVKLDPDLKSLNVHWIISGDKEEDMKTQALLEKHASKLR